MDSSGMEAGVRDYRVETSGRIHLPEEREKRLLPALRAQLATRPGRFDDATSTASLEEVARSVGVRAVRDEDHVLLVTDRDGDIRWSEQASLFYAALATGTDEGEVRFRGEDGAEWSYRFTVDGLVQTGVNGFDGSTGPEAVAPLPAGPEPSADGPHLGPVVPDVPPTPAGHEATAYPPPDVEPLVSGPPAPVWGHAPEQAGEPAPRSPGRTLGMAVLLLGGVFMILMIAILAAGIA